MEQRHELQPPAANGAAGGGIPASGEALDAVSEDGIVIKLTRRVAKDANTDIGELKLRLPRLGDWIDIGPVMRVYGYGDPMAPNKVENDLDREALMRWAMRLSNESRNTIEQLNAVDARRLFASIVALVNVFTDMAGK